MNFTARYYPIYFVLILGTNLGAMTITATGVYGGGSINGVLNNGDEVTISLDAKESGVPYYEFDYNSAIPSLEARSNEGSLWSNITSNFLITPISSVDLNQPGVYHNFYLNDQGSYFELEINAFSESTGLTLDFGNSHTPEIVTRFEILIRNDELGNGWNTDTATITSHSEFLSYNYSSYSPSVLSQSNGSIRFQTNGRSTSYSFDLTNLSIIPEASTYALLLGGTVLGYAFWRRRK